MPVRIAERILFTALLLAAAGGCMTPSRFPTPAVLPDNGSQRAGFLRAELTITNLFPAGYRATQRAIITTGGKQFTCDGLLQVSPTDGHHLALVSSFGVVTDLRLRPDGSCELLKVTPIFREDWSRRFVARDLRRLFVPPANLQPAGRLADGSVVLQTPPDVAGLTARYIFSADGRHWLRLDLLRDGQTCYQAKPRYFQKFAGRAAEIPGEFDVNAPNYRLQLSITEMTTVNPEGSR